jgi:hypothetical protein
VKIDSGVLGLDASAAVLLAARLWRRADSGHAEGARRPLEDDLWRLAGSRSIRAARVT